MKIQVIAYHKRLGFNISIKGYWINVAAMFDEIKDDGMDVIEYKILT